MMMKNDQPGEKAPAGLRAFMHRLIDYAGLFPPARLPLPKAMANYMRHRQEAEAWMLDRFIMTAGRLAELDQFVPLFAADAPLPLVVLGRGGDSAAVFQENLAEDMAAIREFRAKHGGAVSVNAFEVRLPAGVLKPPHVTIVQGILNGAHALLAGTGDLQPFYEVPLAPADLRWERAVEVVTQTLAAHNRARANDARVLPAGFKLRCGGDTPDYFPSPAQVAHALLAAREHGVLLKCTAGLHHPLRHDATDMDVKMHGFFNLFGAGILAHVHNLDADHVETILMDEDVDHFSFDDDGFAWQDLPAGITQIEGLRKTAFAGYGSCSFAEPRNDLRGLGLI